jgi:hypothetical protein
VVAPELARTRVGALLLVAAAVLGTLLSPLLSAGTAHQTSVATGLSATTRTTLATAARGSLGQTPERVARAAVQARAVAQLSQTAGAPVGQHLTAALAGVGLLLALAGRRLPPRARPRTPSGTERATQRNRGPPRAAARLA